MVNFPIERLRKVSENVIGMPDTCEILGEEPVPDERGSWTTSEVVLDSSPCRISPLSESEVAQYGQLVERAMAKITMPFGKRLDAENRIRVTTRTYENEQGETVPEVWEVIGVPARSAALSAHAQALVRRHS